MLIGNSYLNNLSAESYSDNYYQLPLIERIKKRGQEENNKKIIKCKKRKEIYLKDNYKDEEKSFNNNKYKKIYLK